MQKKTNYRWIVMAILFILYTVANADRANLGFALPYIRQEFNMTNTEAGAIISFFFFAYAFFQIPSGFLVKKFGNKVMFCLGMAVTSICTGLMAVAPNALAFKLCRLGVGIGEAPVAISSSGTINNWFPPKEKGTATGIFLAGSKMGPLVVPFICAWIIQMWSWHMIFVGFMIPGLMLAVVWYFLVANRPRESRFCNDAEADYVEQGEAVVKEEIKSSYNMKWLDKIVRAKKVVPLSSAKEVFRCKDMWAIAIGYFFVVGLSSVFMSWLPSYLVNVKHFAIMKTAFVAAAPFAGTVVGNFFGGWASDHIFGKRRKPMMMITALSTSVFMYAMLSAPESPVLLGLLLFGAGVFLAFGYSMYMAYGMGRADHNTYPVAFSLVNTGGQIGGAIMPLIVGVILDNFSWDAVWLTIAIGSLICFAVVCTAVEPVDDPLV
ncbi:MAG: MFS transporter [Megasphaera sp.]|jgi:sugar phosphate permease|uniref:MFS transporter n=1 Tax=Megasphaera sueciensis TaxID=349094 RepID=UPI003D03FA23|nr:MFS transporter [Megasphaera sp.]MCI1824202.1 MFS transporter [Megasphaera sp.]